MLVNLRDILPSRATPVCRLASRRATYGPYRPQLDGPFRRAKNGPSQTRRPEVVWFRWLQLYYRTQRQNSREPERSPCCVPSSERVIFDNSSHSITMDGGSKKLERIVLALGCLWPLPLEVNPFTEC